MTSKTYHLKSHLATPVNIRIPYLPQGDDLETKMIRIELLASLVRTYRALEEMQRQASASEKSSFEPGLNRIREFLGNEG